MQLSSADGSFKTVKTFRFHLISHHSRNVILFPGALRHQHNPQKQVSQLCLWLTLEKNNTRMRHPGAVLLPATHTMWGACGPMQNVEPPGSAAPNQQEWSWRACMVTKCLKLLLRHADVWAVPIHSAATCVRKVTFKKAQGTAAQLRTKSEVHPF